MPSLDLPALLLLATWIPAQQATFIPAANTLDDGNSRFWIGGTVQPERQLTLIDGSLLQPLLGETIHAIAFRRNAESEALVGGSAQLTVRMSHASRSWSNASVAFGQNHGQDVVAVFQGTVTLPSSPATNATQVAWTAANAVEILFQVPFRYLGGTLAVEIAGQPDPQQPTAWWPADAAWEPNAGNEVSVGNGCGQFGGPAGQWSFVSADNLVPGGSALFTALGPVGELAYWMLADRTLQNAVDLGPFGSPGCFAHVQTPLAGEVVVFAHALRPGQPALGAFAQFHLPVPSSPSFLGASFASQWFGLGSQGITASNAHGWSIAGQAPTLAMTLVTAAGENATSGKLVPGCGHVLRFSH